MKQVDSNTARQKHTFIIAVICYVVGAIFRIAYCLQYTVQPRDAYTYGHMIDEWDKTGRMIGDISFIPFSLWILKIPRHIFYYDSIKGGILVNLLIGMLMIVITVYFLSHFFKNDLSTLFGGLIVATHPALVHFSCSCLRENTYLFFSLLTILFLIRYFIFFHLIQLFFASLFGAFAFLCRVEGIEVLAVFFILLASLTFLKRIEVIKAILHGLLFVFFFLSTWSITCYWLGLRNLTLSDIMIRLAINHE